MSRCDFVEYSLASVTIVINVVALVIMNRSKDNIKNKDQRNIGIVLCLCELSGAVFSICFLHAKVLYLKDYTRYYCLLDNDI